MTYGFHSLCSIHQSVVSCRRRCCSCYARRVANGGWIFDVLNMEQVEHLWNVTKFLSKTADQGVDSLRTHYVERCRRLGDQVELPNKIFGPAVMCSHCGSPWSGVKHRVRIAPGRVPSNKISKLIQNSKEADIKPGRFKGTLLKKCLKNRMNSLVVTCSVCSMDTKIALEKPPRRKLPKVEDPVRMQSGRKRKKRTKDKTAGLKIPGSLISERLKPTGFDSNAKTPQTKPKKNDLNKLQGMLKKLVTPSKKSSLHSFIKEL